MRQQRPQPAGVASATTGTATHPPPSCIFDDFSFRFSNTYTVVERADTTHNRPSARQPHKPSGAASSGPEPPAPGATIDGSGVQLTPAFASGLRQLEARGRVQQQRREAQAAKLLRYARNRKPQVTPSFLSKAAPSAESEEPAAAPPAAVSVGPFMPTRRPLPPPALGLAAGVVAGTMGEATDVFPLTAPEQHALLGTERAMNEALFTWWDDRAAMRLHEQFRAQLDAALQPELEGSARDMIAEEESYWLRELCGGQPGLHGTQVCVNPKLKPFSSSPAATAGAATAGGGDMMAQHNGLTPAGATNRGLIVPLKSLEGLFRGLRVMLHERASTLLSTYDEREWAATHAFNPDAIARVMQEDSLGQEGDTAAASTQSDRGDSAAARSIFTAQQQLAAAARKAHLRRLLEAETELAKSALATATASAAEGRKTGEDDASSLAPACVSLPPDRLLQPLMVIETATSVALLWKILEQVRTVVPGMGFALQLFRHYIMPHLYEHYTAVDGVLPRQVGSLGDQMSRFCALPLRTRTHLLAGEAVQQSKADVKYMEHAMKQWALRSWRKAVADRHRRAITRAACLGLLERVARRATLRAAFTAWRAEARESAHVQYMRSIDKAYRAFLAGSALSAKMDCLPLTITSADSPGVTHSSHRTRVIAMKLAETATQSREKAIAVKKQQQQQQMQLGATGKQQSTDTVPLRPVGEQNVYLPPVPIPPSSGGAPSPPLGRSSPAADSARAERQGSWTAPATTSSVRLRGLFSGAAMGVDDGSNAAAAVTDMAGEPKEGEDHEKEKADDRRRAALEGGRARRRDTPATAFPANEGPFEEMLARLQETEEVCDYLRAEIAVQGKMLRKLEQDKRGLQERNRTLEADLLRTVEEKLHYCNVVQEKQFSLQERDRRIVQLKSRLRAHRNRPWQRVVMRVMGEMCGSSTQVAEALDEYRVRSDLRSDPNDRVKTYGEAGEDGEEEGDEVLMGALVDDGPGAREAEQERLFGELAPIVLSSTRQLPDALVILQDWANSALDDLQSLDDLKGGALSVRFSTFSEEARSGVLLSRLLFYLALPRYLRRTAANTDANGAEDSPSAAEGKRKGTRRRNNGAGGKKKQKDADDKKPFEAEDFFGVDYPDRRRQLLEQRNVQLDSPFPVYSECFGDLLSMRPSERMTLLLQFATELVAGSDPTPSDALAIKRQAVEEAVLAATKMTAPLSAGRIELQEVVDPHSLAAGERASIVTLVALLYTRFAHPFNHKCKQSAAIERAAMLHLLSGGSGPVAAPGSPGGVGSPLVKGGAAASDAAGAGAVPGGEGAGGMMTLQEELLAHLDDEDKSPWQLFKERCLPVFGSDAHPFLLRGNFWPSNAFDSPSLANLLGELGMALNRSLQLHRWHVTLSCLVPIMTYSGLSRGVFTGPRASTVGLRVGLEREGEWEFPLHGSSVKRVCERRGMALLDGRKPAGRLPSAVDREAATQRLVQHIGAEKNRLMAALKVTSEDLLALFLRRSTLSAELALPTLDLGGWRLLCGDLNLVGLGIGTEDQFPLDLDAVTALYFEAVAALNEATEQPRLYAVTTTTTATTAAEAGGRAYGAILQEKRVSAFAFAGSEATPDILPLSDAALEAIRRRHVPRQAARADSFDAEASPMEANPTAPPASVEDGSHADPFVPLPAVYTAMTFTAFATAMVLVADRVYPALSRGRRSSPAGAAGEEGGGEADESDGAEEEEDRLDPHRWLGDAIRALVLDHVVASSAGNVLLDEPRAVIRRLQMGSATQEVIAAHTPALTLVFNAYSKEVYGSPGMEKEDLLRLLRDAMLTSTEVSQYLIFELFQHCCVTQRACEEDAAARRRELDNRPRSPGWTSGSPGGVERQRARRAVSILDPRTDAGAPSYGKHRGVQVLVLEGFIDFLCVLCHFKQPNPLIPVHQRFNVFLRRSVLRPLSHRVEGIASFLNQLKLTREAQDGGGAGAEDAQLRAAES